MKKPNTILLAAVSRGFNWASAGPYTIDGQTPANADWPSSGFLLCKCYADPNKFMDIYLIYTALSNTAAGGNARFTITGLIPFNTGGNPPAKDTCQAGSIPASGAFNIDTVTKLTAGNWPTAVGTLVGVSDGAKYWVFTVNSFSVSGGAGGKSRWNVTFLAGSAVPDTITAGAVFIPAIDTNSRIVYESQGPISYDAANDYFD